jgi:hypothetical protein
MTTRTRSSRMFYWLLFFIFTALFIVAVMTRFEYLTLILPFVCTFLVLAMDII